MYKIIIIIMLLGLLAGCTENDTVSSPEPTQTVELPQILQKDFVLLKTTDTFAGTAVGYGGSVPPQIPAFQNILNHPKADELFSDLRKSATLEGQIYALCGLYLSDKSEFDQVIHGYKNNYNKVTTFFGCIMDEKEVLYLVPSIQNGTWPEAFKNCQVQ